VPLARTEDIVRGAARAGHGALAFNVVTLEHAEAVVTGAEGADRPVTLQLSENAIRFHLGRIQPIAAAMRAMACGAGVPVSLHLDHVEDPALLRLAAGVGFSSVMYDASTMSYDENVSATQAAVEWAHGQGLWLEAELGAVGGKDGAHAPGVRTDPAEAAAYVAATGVDSLAVAVGSSHAMTTQSSVLDLDLIARLREAVPVPLVLHGSSGVSEEHLVEAVTQGMVKINIGTTLNVAYTGAIQAAMTDGGLPTDPRKYLGLAREAIAARVCHLLLTLRPAERTSH
jgi:fructose-bisphosphate aldolase, class II